jgi:uncharacterized protein (DUF608 family)
VDWYSQLLLMVFPEKEKAICQKFIDSIGGQDNTEVYFHWHAASAQMRVEFEEWKKLKALVDSGKPLPGDAAARFEYLEYEADVGDGKKGYNGRSLTHIKGPKKLKGSVSHDVGRLTAGNPMRGNVSEYDWFNTNFWVDLFPKLAQRVARNAKFTNDTEFVAKNWATLQTGFTYWIGLDRDGDGIPEGNPGEVKNTFDNIKLFGYDSYSASLALAGYKSMTRMAEIMLDKAGAEAERSTLRAKIADYRARFEKAKRTAEKLWVRTRNQDGTEGGYFATCYDPKVAPEEMALVCPELERNGYIVNGEIQDKFWEVSAAENLEGNYPDRQATFNALRVHKSFDVFTNQLDGLWAWIAMGEDPEDLVKPARVQMILKTIYENNRVTNGWATQRTADGREVKSDQGKDVWIASNYVLAHMLDYCGLAEESKDVYKVMDEILLQHDNTSTSPESVRPDENKFIVKGYPRPGAVWTQLPLFFFKAQKQAGKKTSTPQEMKAFMQGIFNPDGAAMQAFRSRGQGKTESAHWGPKAGRIPYGLSRVRPGAGTGPAMPGGGGTAGSVLA